MITHPFCIPSFGIEAGNQRKLFELSLISLQFPGCRCAGNRRKLTEASSEKFLNLMLCRSFASVGTAVWDLVLTRNCDHPWVSGCCVTQSPLVVHASAEGTGVDHNFSWWFRLWAQLTTGAIVRSQIHRRIVGTWGTVNRVRGTIACRAGSCSMRFVCVRPPAADATELSTSSLQFALDEVQDVLTCGATCCVPVRLRKAAVRSGPHLGVSKHAMPASTRLYQP